MPFSQVAPDLWRGTLDPTPGELRTLWQGFGAGVIVGHPTFRNEGAIGRLLADGVRDAGANFPGRKVSFIVSDGTCTAASGDSSTMDAAEAAAREALDSLSAEQRQDVQVVVTPYEGYGGDRTPGKGSALKMIFDEMEGCPATLLVLADGDLRNDMARWQGVFARVEREHQQRHGDHPFFVTARYARHFVDASLTRFIVGPLTTLMGQYVPGGISGDIVLSAGAVAHERQSAWTEARRKYGTDISTTFDNIADAGTVIYEVYLGAKLHDITDEAKLSVMPGEVIGAALERLLHWERADGRVSRWLEPGRQLVDLEVWGPERTGIGFVDPGHTDVFDVDAKLATLRDRFAEYEQDIRQVQGEEVAAIMAARVEALGGAGRGGEEELAFLGVDRTTWTEMMHRAVAHLLVHGEVAAPKRCLGFLYTAAFLEFVKDRLADLGYRTVAAVRQAQANLGVAPELAEAFYEEKVDRASRELAMGFFEGRKRILHYKSSME